MEWSDFNLTDRFLINFFFFFIKYHTFVSVLLVSTLFCLTENDIMLEGWERNEFNIFDESIPIHMRSKCLRSEEQYYRKYNNILCIGNIIVRGNENIFFESV